MTSSTAEKYTTTEYGKQNMFAAEAQPWIDEKDRRYNVTSTLVWSSVGYDDSIIHTRSSYCYSLAYADRC